MLSVKHVPEQLCFPGLDPTPTDRLFFAIFADAPAAGRIAEITDRLRVQYDLKGRPLGSRRFHVSLHCLGDYAGLPNDVVAKAHAAASTVVAAPFGITFDRAGSFGVRRRKLPLVLRGSDSHHSLTAFQQALGDAMARNGLGRPSLRSFTPHVTLLYDVRHVETCAVEPVEWTVREFVLVHSLVGRTKHIPLARWPLHEGRCKDVGIADLKEPHDIDYEMREMPSTDPNRPATSV